jgi:glutathione S-transferase
MPTLFISPSACSFGAHVIVNILNAGYRQSIGVVKVPLRRADSPIHKINPLGKVPALQIDDKEVLTENSAILPYLGDLVPEAGLFAPAGTLKRARIQEWIGLANSELHGAFRAVFRPEYFNKDAATHANIRQQGLVNLEKLLAHIERKLPDSGLLFGETATIADAYLGYYLRNVSKLDLPAGKYPRIAAYVARYNDIDAVKAALAFEAA